MELTESEEALVDGFDLKRVRLRVGLTQKQLAVASGVAQQHVSAIERGVPTMPLTDDRARKLGPALGVDPARLRLGDFNQWVADRLQSGDFGVADAGEFLKRAESLTKSSLLDDEEKYELLVSLEPVMAAVFTTKGSPMSGASVRYGRGTTRKIRRTPEEE